MSAITDILDWLCGEAGAVIGPNVPNGGVSLVQSGGGLPDKHLDGNMVSTMQVVLTAKHQNQKSALDLAADAHKALTKTFDYPSDDGWQVLDISTITYPAISEIEQEGAYFVTSVIEVTYYWRED